MAFPTVAGFGGSNSGANVTSTTPDIVTLAGSPAVGDLLVIVITKDGAGLFTWPAGWVQMPTFPRSCESNTPNVNAVLDCKYLNYDGVDDLTPTLTHANEGTAWQVYRITNWFGTEDTGSVDALAIDALGTNPNPPDLDPAGWGTEDTLWIAVCGNDGDIACTAGPTTPGTWTNFQNNRWAQANGCGVASARSNNASGSVDPDAFTMANEQHGAGTIAIRPAASALRTNPVIVNQAVNRAGSY